MVTTAPSSGPFPLYLLIVLIDKSYCAKSMLTSSCWVHWHKLVDGGYSSGDKAVFRLVVQVFNIWYLFPDKLRSSRVGYHQGQGVQLQLTFGADFPTQDRLFCKPHCAAPYEGNSLPYFVFEFLSNRLVLMPLGRRASAELSSTSSRCSMAVISP